MECGKSLDWLGQNGVGTKINRVTVKLNLALFIFLIFFCVVSFSCRYCDILRVSGKITNGMM